MKKVIVIIFPILLVGQDPNMSENIQNIINQAKDYYDVSLFDDSKSILLKLLHSNEGKPFEAEIRYHLGLACWYSDNYSDAKIQWNKVITKFPTNKRSQELNRVFSNLTQSIDSTHYFREEEFEYGNDLQTGFLLWSPTYVNKKLLWSELKDAGRATTYYWGLIEKYDDPKKKFQFLYYLFLLESGYNSNHYGYGTAPLGSGPQTIDSRKRHHLISMHNLLREMKAQITDESIDPNFSTLVQAYYVAGVKVSGSSFLMGSVKVNEDSKFFFEKVIEFTNDNEHNIYRIFSQHWLKK